MGNQSFFSRGKLILMGEYAVLHGVDALCLPLKTGQELTITPSENGQINWEWYYRDYLVAGFSFHPATLSILNINKGEPAWVLRLLELVREKKPDFLSNGATLTFHNRFPVNWGLGTSSATVSSVCRLAGIEPYTINEKLTGGSGADIATTTANNWILYRKTLTIPQRWEIPLSYRFAENTWFIYSGKKQETARHINKVTSQYQKNFGSWAPVNEFVYRFVAATTLPELMKIVNDHELFIAEATGLNTIRDKFPDFPGTLKSLGAWGGDFFMALSHQKDDFVRDYFSSRGYTDIFSWKQLTETPDF